MNRIWIICLTTLFFNIVAEAQHLPLFTQYRENAGVINPAAVNSDYIINEHNMTFGASYRRQWLGLASSPQTQTIRGEYLFDPNGGFGMLFGGYLVNDQTGPTGFTGAYGKFATIITDDPSYSGLSIGIAAGVVQYRVNVSELRVRDLNDDLTTDDQAKIFPDAGIGAFYYQTVNWGFLDDDQIYAGISVPQLFGLDLNFKDDTGDFSLKRVQHFYGTLGLYKYVGDEGFVEPSIWIKYAPNAPINIDFNLRYQMVNRFWIGTGLSTAGTFHLEAGFVLGENLGYDNNVKIGYGYDYSFNTFGPFVGSTHEINVAYTLPR